MCLCHLPLNVAILIIRQMDLNSNDPLNKWLIDGKMCVYLLTSVTSITIITRFNQSFFFFYFLNILVMEGAFISLLLLKPNFTMLAVVNTFERGMKKNVIQII